MAVLNEMKQYMSLFNPFLYYSFLSDATSMCSLVQCLQIVPISTVCMDRFVCDSIKKYPDRELPETLVFVNQESQHDTSRGFP